MKKYKLAACGGTFDLFHRGHKDFLNYIFNFSDEVIIGITSDTFASSKKTFEDFSTRKNSVLKFLKSNKYNGKILEIDDIYGPTLSDKYYFDSLFVTSDSKRGAERINEKRKELSLSLLKIIKIPLFKTPDGKAISSSRIRKGEIDRNGDKYIDEKLFTSDYVLPDTMREKLSKPFGKFVSKIKDETSDDKIITVGDETTKTFLSKKIHPRLSIVDLKNNREKKYKSISDLGLFPQKIIKAVNPSGHITKELFEAVINGLKNKNSVILIDGEEDLAVIPVVLASPLGYEIYYGQPSEGVVKIEVTEEKKQEIKKLISKFTRKVI